MGDINDDFGKEDIEITGGGILKPDADDELGLGDEKDDELEGDKIDLPFTEDTDEM